jgi:hypothetical protein
MADTYFLAGVMQGSRAGDELADQSYRESLREVILECDPRALVHDPGELMAEWLGEYAAEIRQAHTALAGKPSVRKAELGAPLRRLTEVFHRLTELAASSDICVAWLPGHQASMGTAAEMLSAYRAGRTVVAITPMRQNLAVLACSTVILPDLESFSAWLADDLQRGSRSNGPLPAPSPVPIQVPELIESGERR